MTDTHKCMVKALKAIVVPRIHNLGFGGAFPYFHRRRGEEHQMLMLKFNRHGSSFYLEAGRITQEEFELTQQRWHANGKELRAADLNVGHCAEGRRARLGGSAVGPDDDRWFVYGPDDRGLLRRILFARRHGDYESVANRVVQVVREQVEAFFDNA